MRNKPRYIKWALAIASWPMVLLADEAKPLEPKALPAPDQPVAPVQPVLEQVSETQYRLATIEFDKKKREIRFPAVVNMKEGLLEFALVHENGKVHESLLVTKISPTQLNTVIKLLRFPASAELYALPNETGGLSGNFPVVADDIRAAARMQMELEYDKDGKKIRVNIDDWIKNQQSGDRMENMPWVYGGAEVYQGRFASETTGDMIAIFTSRSAMINFTGDLKENDEVWVPFPGRVPDPGTPVTVILSPFPDGLIKEALLKEKLKKSQQPTETKQES